MVEQRMAEVRVDFLRCDITMWLWAAKRYVEDQRGCNEAPFAGYVLACGHDVIERISKNRKVMETFKLTGRDNEFISRGTFLADDVHVYDASGLMKDSECFLIERHIEPNGSFAKTRPYVRSALASGKHVVLQVVDDVPTHGDVSISS